MSNKQFLEDFFNEKEVQTCEFAKKDHAGNIHFIDTDAVIDFIKRLPEGSKEQADVVAIIRQIDFHNGDIMHFLEHCAQGMAFAFEAQVS